MLCSTDNLFTINYSRQQEHKVFCRWQKCYRKQLKHYYYYYYYYYYRYYCCCCCCCFCCCYYYYAFIWSKLLGIASPKVQQNLIATHKRQTNLNQQKKSKLAEHLLQANSSYNYYSIILALRRLEAQQLKIMCESNLDRLGGEVVSYRHTCSRLPFQNIYKAD